jgi:hypothetical protein
VRRVTAGNVLVGTLLLAGGALETQRLVDLWRRGSACVSAHGESRWRPWAYRRDDLPRVLGEAAAQLRDGESVALLVPPGLNHDWWQVMALYYFPRQTVVGVYDLPDRSTPPPTAARVVVDRRGRSHVLPPLRRNAG